MNVERTAVQLFLIVEGPRDAATQHLAAAVAKARADGWTIVRGWAAPLSRELVICTGWVRSDDDARRALLAAVAGAGLVIGVRTSHATLGRLVDDLRRLGRVERIAVPDPNAAQLTDGQRALLSLLAEGLTIREAAAELGVHRTTAARRLEEARRLLG